MERRKIFVADRDRRHWLELMGEAVETFGLIVHTFVLMDNHVHTIIELQESNLALAMQWLNGSYGMWCNRRHQRVGPLVQGIVMRLSLQLIATNFRCCFPSFCLSLAVLAWREVDQMSNVEV